jgi:hypothetical protein
VNTWITLSVVALLPVLLRTRKLLMPMRISASDPWRMAGGYRRYKIQTFTGRAKKGRYFMVYNHTTRQAFFSNHDIRKALTFPFPPLYVAALTLMILPIPVLVFFGLVDIWQVARFKKAGVRPLVAALDERALPVPIPA